MAQKITKPPPGFQPEYSRLNKQVIMETNCPVPKDMSDDAILAGVDSAFSHHKICFLTARRFFRGNLTLETQPNTSIDTGAMLSIEINMAHDELCSFTKGIHAKRRWTGFFFHGVLTHISTPNTPAVCTKMADKITAATAFTIAKASRWITPASKLTNQEAGSIIIMFPGNVWNTGRTPLFLFKRRCGIEKALPSS